MFFDIFEFLKILPRCPASFVHTASTRRIDPRYPEGQNSKNENPFFWDFGFCANPRFVAGPVSFFFDLTIYSPKKKWDPSRVVRNAL